MTPSVRAFCWLLLMLLNGNADCAASETLGRLFFTPPQRQALDRQRQAHARLPAGSAGNVLTVHGEIRRSNGRSVRRWITDQAGEVDDSKLPALPVGTSYHPATGDRDDLLGDGWIRIQPGSVRK